MGRIPVALLVAALGVLAAVPGAPARRRHARPRATRPIVNGLYTSAYPTTGALLAGPSASTAALRCSGTLVGCSTFVTAAHCVEDDTDPAHYFVFLQHAATVAAVGAVRLHPAYEFPVADVAILTLATPITGIAPMPLAPAAPPPGTAGTIVGFGTSGGTAGDYGLKREGAVVTARCTAGVSDATSVCWDFAAPLGPPGTDANTCNGDSGGPLVLAVGGAPALVGITSGGVSTTCLPTDHSYDANVSAYAAWVAAEVGGDLGTGPCGGLAAVGSEAAPVVGSTGTLDAASPEGRHAILVPHGTSELRVALNAIDDGSDFDLYLRAGAAPTPTDFDCKHDGPNQFAVCTVIDPPPGAWHVLVARHIGGGPYQVTATRFGVDCSLAANAGTPCHASLCTATAACEGGTCTPVGGPAVGCFAPVRSRGGVLLARDASDDADDRLTWKWAPGSAFTATDLGNPTVATPYAVCLWEERAGTPVLVLERVVPPGVGWRPARNGFRYADRDASAAGVRSLKLAPGIAGRARVTFDARGPSLGLAGLPLAQEPRVTLQLVAPGRCWDASYSTSTRNDGEVFRARAD